MIKEHEQFKGREIEYSSDSSGPWASFVDTKGQRFRIVGRGKTKEEMVFSLYCNILAS